MKTEIIEFPMQISKYNHLKSAKW